MDGYIIRFKESEFSKLFIGVESMDSFTNCFNHIKKHNYLIEIGDICFMLQGWHEGSTNLFHQQGIPIVTIKEAMILDLVGAFIPDPHLGVLVQQLTHQISISWEKK